MRRRFLSMRWWLALAFAGIAALTAVAVAQVFQTRSESAIRARAQELAAGSAVAAASRVSTAETPEGVAALATEAERSRQLALFVFGEDRSLLTPSRSRGISVAQLPNFATLLDAALAGRRAVESIDEGRLVTVALPLRGEHGAALIAVASRPDLEDALGIVQDEIVSAALWAVIIAAVAGLVVATLITRRLRRITATAADIERGRFDRELRPRFPDELGTLAETIDRMRERLQRSFDRLEGERDRLERLLEQLQEGVVAVDRSLAVEFANTRSRELVSPELTPGRPLPEPWQTVPLRTEVERLFQPDATPRSIRIHPDQERALLVALLPPSPLSDAAVVVVTDVTARERRERAEREFVTNAAHELRTPLAAIASAVEVLQEGAKEEAAERDRFLAVVERQTTRLTRLVHALLTLARAQTRAESVQLESVELGPLVHELVEGLPATSPALEVCCDDVRVFAHGELLRQTLDNLAANALRHAGGAGLAVRVSHVDGGRVRIEIADRGPGMSAADAERAADRFYRGASPDGEGFGLGLSIVRELVAAMDGALTIDSRPGEGTVVAVELRGSGEGRRCG